MMFLVEKRVETEKPGDNIKVKYTLQPVNDEGPQKKATVTTEEDLWNIGDEIEITRASRQEKIE